MIKKHILGIRGTLCEVFFYFLGISMVETIIILNRTDKLESMTSNQNIDIFIENSYIQFIFIISLCVINIIIFLFFRPNENAYLSKRKRFVLISLICFICYLIFFFIQILLGFFLLYKYVNVFENANCNFGITFEKFRNSPFLHCFMPVSHLLCWIRTMSLGFCLSIATASFYVIQDKAYRRVILYFIFCTIGFEIGFTFYPHTSAYVTQNIAFVFEQIFVIFFSVFNVVSSKNILGLRIRGD